MNKIKKGDSVLVITGKDKGKEGIVLSIIDNGKKLIVEGINLVRKCVKQNPQTGEKGGMIDKSMPIDRSNVLVKGSRIGIRISDNGQRVRYLKSNNQSLDENK